MVTAHHGRSYTADELGAAAAEFAKVLENTKRNLNVNDFGWYPYGSLANFFHFDLMLTGEHRQLLEFGRSRPILDIGAADGDTAFFLESLGNAVHVLENPPTNFNGCRGLYALRSALGSKIEVTEVDLDSQFRLPAGRFGLAFMLGLLYHLKNPMFVLESLAKQVEHMVLSTRVTQYNVAHAAEGRVPGINPVRVDISAIPVAYLVDPMETNDDPTNYWMFTHAGLRRILSRTGWEILDFVTVGTTDGSDPATMDHDERAFCFVRSTLVDA